MTMLLHALLYIIAAVYGLMLAGALFWCALAGIQTVVARAFKRADWMPEYVSASGKRRRDPL
jgi:hypothetical protein